jgi:hypothetical protein
MATIRKNIFLVSEAVVRDAGDETSGGKLGAQIQALAVNAIVGGIGSEDWKTYMSLFADNKGQLARLSAEDDFAKKPENHWVKVSLAYLASNGVCGAATTGSLHLRVEDDSDLDGGIADDKADGTIVKPLAIVK